MPDDTQVKNTAVSVMNQLPANELAESLAQSPLFSTNFSTRSQNTSTTSQAGVQAQEQKFLGHLVIRANAADKKVKSTIKNILGLELPSVLQSNRSETLSIYWISPDEWLLICPGDLTFGFEKELNNVMTGHFSIVNVSGGQTVLTLSGEHARDVLMKSTPYDVSDQNFPIGKVVTSALAKSQATICRKSDTSWELIIRRTFSHYIWSWLERSCEEYVLVVKD